MRAVPHRQQGAHARAGNIDGAGQQRIVDGRTAGELGPLHLDVDALLLALLLDQLLVARHVEQQVDHAELLGNADLPLRVGRTRGRHAGCERQRDDAARPAGGEKTGTKQGHAGLQWIW